VDALTQGLGVRRRAFPSQLEAMRLVKGFRYIRSRSC
jgi:hypothetical protein